MHMSKRSRTSSKYVYYALHLYFSGLSLRKTSQHLLHISREGMIDDTIRNKSYLLNPRAVEEWMEIRDALDRDINVDTGRLRLVVRIYGVINLLINEYNSTLDKYQKIENEDLQKIPTKKKLQVESFSFVKHSSSPSKLVAKITVHDDDGRGIEKVVVEGETTEPANIIRYTACSTDSSGTGHLEVYADEAGLYTIKCRIHRDGYETETVERCYKK